MWPKTLKVCESCGEIAAYVADYLSFACPVHGTLTQLVSVEVHPVDMST